MFVIVYAARTLHLEILLTALTTGFFVQNVSSVKAEPFVHALGKRQVGPGLVRLSDLGASCRAAARRRRRRRAQNPAGPVRAAR